MKKTNTPESHDAFILTAVLLMTYPLLVFAEGSSINRLCYPLADPTSLPTDAECAYNRDSENIECCHDLLAPINGGSQGGGAHPIIGPGQGGNSHEIPDFQDPQEDIFQHPYLTSDKERNQPNFFQLEKFQVPSSPQASP